MTSTNDTRTDARALLRSLDLLIDGPARWEAQVTSRSPGVFIVELPGGAESAPVDIVAVRRWIERVPGLTLDNARPTPQDLARHLHEHWNAGEPILYVGRTAKSLGGRVGSMYATPLGDAKPHPGGHWLKTLSVLRDLRVWWAETDAHEEYEDALLTAIADRNDGHGPFANNSLPGSLTTEPTIAPIGMSAPKRAAPAKPRAATTRRTPTLKGAAAKPAVDATQMTAEGLERLTNELDNLRTNVRPEVIQRVKTAREFGDLKENADYEYARKEQSFVEGRIQTLEALLRNGVVVEDQPLPEKGAGLGSTLTVESDGDRMTFTLVSSAEANAGAGRISNVSPVGQALMGSRSGDEVTVTLPVGAVVYRVLEVR